MLEHLVQSGQGEQNGELFLHAVFGSVAFL